MIKNKIISFLYKNVLKPIFFLQDPEDVHDKMTLVGVFLGKSKLGRKITKLFFNYENKILNQNILGIDFKNPVGLSAGFDKDGQLTDILPSVGFGFAEIGSITGEYCEGNKRPRLWRLKKSKALLVYYGLKNKGAEILHKNLKNKKFEIPIGISVAMTNNEKNSIIENGILDFKKAFQIMEDIGSYITVNISCPNTCTGQPFIIPENLENLLKELDKVETQKPVFVKLSPDISFEEIDIILEILKRHRVHGIITTNLTKKRNNEKIKDENIPAFGGISGKVVEDMSNNVLSYIYKKEGHKFVLIGCGGISNGLDAYKKIRLGASLVQMITGMIFEGPQIVGDINYELSKLLKKDGFNSISEVIGIDVK
jgi:dihydroorotate dehydrogenase